MDVLSLLNIDATTFAALTALIYLLVEGIKNKFPTTFTGGWKTQLLALVISGGTVAAYLHGIPNLPTWAIGAFLTLIAWVAPAGIHNIIKKE